MHGLPRFRLFIGIQHAHSNKYAEVTKNLDSKLVWVVEKSKMTNQNEGKTRTPT